MNATRAATIRLRSSFDGAVSLGRVQTPTLAILARREEEIRAFKPEPYWLVDASFETVQERMTRRRQRGWTPSAAAAPLRGPLPRRRQPAAEDRRRGARGRRGRPRPDGHDHQAREVGAQGAPAAALRPDVAAARRQPADSASPPGAPWPPPSGCTRSTRRSRIREPTPATSPATWSATSSRSPSWWASAASTPRRSKYVLGLDVLPLGRVVNDAKVTDHHAIIPTRAERHPVDKFDEDERRIYDLVVRRFLAIFHPMRCSRTPGSRRPSPTHVFRTRGKLMLVPGWRGVYGEGPRRLTSRAGGRRRGHRAAAAQAEPRTRTRACSRSPSAEKETKPPRRYSEGTLLAAMETAGKLVDEEELREAMKDSGIGTPATRAAIIERLLQVGYIERDGRALVVTEKGLNVIRLLGEHPLTSPGPDRRLGAPPGPDRDRAGLPRGVHGRHRQVHRGRRSASSTRS